MHECIYHRATNINILKIFEQIHKQEGLHISIPTLLKSPCPGYLLNIISLKLISCSLAWSGIVDVHIPMVSS